MPEPEASASQRLSLRGPLIAVAFVFFAVLVSQPSFRNRFDHLAVDLSWISVIALSVAPLGMLIALFLVTLAVQQWGSLRLRGISEPLIVVALGMIVGFYVIGIIFGFPRGPNTLSAADTVAGLSEAGESTPARQNSHQTRAILIRPEENPATCSDLLA